MHPYEIHITVDNAPDGETFREICKVINVKAVMLDLQTRSSTLIRDVMTSSTICTNLSGAHSEAQRIVCALQAHGLMAIRRKIETVPWNPMCLELTGSDNYFESHISVRLRPHMGDRHVNTIQDVCKELGLHLSSNIYKADSNGVVYMATLRLFGVTSTAFHDHVIEILRMLKQQAIDVDSHVNEFVVFDSNVAHDDAWTSRVWG